MEVLSEIGGHLATSLDGHRLAGEIIFAPANPGCRLHSYIHSVGSDRRGIARKAEQPGDVVGLQLDVLHVGRAGADVLCRDIPTAQGLDEPPVGAKEGLPVGPAIVPDDHGFTAAQVDAGYGRLVGHAAREPECIGDGFDRAAVLPEASSAECRPQRGIVDGDNAEVAAGRIVRQEYLFVSHRLHLGENVGRCCRHLPG
jgi:hypothetical protein